jgi:osmotically inducible lipoprotein OsmB
MLARKTSDGKELVMRKFLISAAAGLALVAASAVSTPSYADPLAGAIIGAGTGAVIGGAVGRGSGAAAGAVIGGVTGAAVGSSVAGPARVRVCYRDDWGRRRCHWKRRRY